MGVLAVRRRFSSPLCANEQKICSNNFKRRRVSLFSWLWRLIDSARAGTIATPDHQGVKITLRHWSCCLSKIS